MTFKIKFKIHIGAILFVLLIYEIILTEASLKNVRVEEIPFSVSKEQPKSVENTKSRSENIQILSRLEDRRHFLHIFHVPYIVCYFAAKGKWPFIPPNVQPRVDSLSRSFFSQNDSYIKQFCQKWIAIKECFRPLFGTSASQIEALPARATSCTCPNDENENYFDRKYLNNASPDTIYNTIEFLESFLPAPTRKTRKKIYVRGRVDEMDVEEK